MELHILNWTNPPTDIMECPYLEGRYMVRMKGRDSIYLCSVCDYLVQEYALLPEHYKPQLERKEASP